MRPHAVEDCRRSASGISGPFEDESNTHDRPAPRAGKESMGWLIFCALRSHPTRRGHACPTPEKCAAQLKILVRTVRDWIGQPQSAEGYATGTRLFAYRALRKHLTC